MYERRRGPSRTERPNDALPPAAGPEGGFGLIELIVSITLLAVVMLGLASAMGAGMKVIASNRYRVVAASLASEDLELARSAGFDSLTFGTTSRTVPVDGVTYTVRREAEWLDQGTGQVSCTSPSAGRSYVRLATRVTWPNMGAVRPVLSETLLTPSGAVADATTGGLALQFLRADGSGAQGVTVSISGATSATPLVTPTSGCALFTDLAAGNYTVTATRPGFVTTNGAASHSFVVGVTAGTISSRLGELYDDAARLSLRLAAPEGYPVPTGIPVTVANNQLAARTRTVPGATTGDTVEVAGLYPFANGYTAWAGSCADADPEGVRPASSPAVRYWPAASRAAAHATSAGATTNGTVALNGVEVFVQGPGGVIPSLPGTPVQPLTHPVAGVQVRAVHDDTTACTTAPAPIVLGTTDATGVVRAALPAGAWRIEVVGQTVRAHSPARPFRMAPESGPHQIVVGL
jgi:type II secretory pathway pseudopilin PulG